MSAMHQSVSEPSPAPIIFPEDAEKEIKLGTIAREAWSETKNDQAAIKIIMARVRQKEGLLAALTMYGARRLLEQSKSTIRVSVQNEYSSKPASSLSLAVGLNRFIGATNGKVKLFDWPMPNSTKSLGDATLHDLEDARIWHEVKAEGEAKRAKMYRGLQEALARSGKATVREGVSEKVVSDLMAGIEEDAA